MARNLHHSSFIKVWPRRLSIKRKGPPKELLEEWVLMAWNALTPDHIKRCWDHTLMNSQHVTVAQTRLQERRARGESDIVLPKAKIVQVDENGVAKTKAQKAI